jgi:regulator of replication initiation timing
MKIEEVIGKEELGKETFESQRNLNRIHQFYHRVVDLAEQNHKTAAVLVEENGRLQIENEGLREFCQELLSSMADLEDECSGFRHKVRSAVLELLPHQKEEKND